MKNETGILFDLLKEYGQHKKGCAVETSSCTCGYSAKISQLSPPSASHRAAPDGDDVAEKDLGEAENAPCYSEVVESGEAPTVELDAERLPYSPDEAIERLRQVLGMLESVTDHNGAVSTQSPLPKARVFLRGIIGCGIAAHQATAPTASVAPLSNDTPANSFPSLPDKHEHVADCYRMDGSTTCGLTDWRDASAELNDSLQETPEGNLRCPVCLSEYKKSGEPQC